MQAVDELARYAPLLPLSEMSASRRCYWERDDGSIPALREREQYEIDCCGRITLCTGVTVGNARKTPIPHIVASRELDQHPVLRALLDGGYTGVLELAVSRGYEPLASYASKCHVCFDARRFLRPLYPDILAPAHVYEEATS